jgi:hypothetical protein
LLLLLPPSLLLHHAAATVTVAAVADAAMELLSSASWLSAVPQPTCHPQLALRFPELMGDASVVAAQPSSAVGSMPWPEGTYSSRRDDLQLSVGGRVVGVSVIGVVGLGGSCMPSLLVGMVEPDIVHRSLRVDGGRSRHSAGSSRGGADVALSDLVRAMAGCEHVGGVVDVDADALASIRLRDTGYMSGVTAMVEGFEVLYAGALLPPDSSSVLVRHPTPQRFVRASVQAVGDGRVLCRVDATDPVWLWKAWSDVFEDDNAELRNDPAITSDGSEAGAPDATGEDPLWRCERVGSWVRNAVAVGSRVFASPNKNNEFTLGLVAEVRVCVFRM